MEVAGGGVAGPPIEDLRQPSPIFGTPLSNTPPIDGASIPGEETNNVRRRPAALAVATSHNNHPIGTTQYMQESKIERYKKIDQVQRITLAERANTSPQLKAPSVDPSPPLPPNPTRTTPTNEDSVPLPPPSLSITPSGPLPPKKLTSPDDGSTPPIVLQHNRIDPDNGDKLYDVNDIVEMTGWGFYQYKVVAVMGMMSFADAAEIWLATIILNNLACEWELSSLEEALIPAVVYFWYAIGSILSGKLADLFGRFPVLLVNSYILVVSAVASAMSPNYYFFLCCRSVTGFCIGGNYGTSIVYAAEMVPITARSLNMLILEGFWTIGSLYELMVAYFVMDLHNGWRIQVLLTALPCLIMLILMHFMDESPRYLTITDQHDKALRVVVKMCKENNIKPPDGKLICQNVKRGEYGDIFSKPYTRSSILIAIHFFCNMFLVFGIIILIPDMMSYNYCEMSQFFDTTYINDLGCLVYTKAEYLFCMVIAALYFPGFCIGTALAEMVGRIPGFWVSIYTSTIFTILLLFCFGTWIIYAELAIVVMGYAAYNEVLWIYSPEVYPTYMRGTAIGVQNGIGKFGAALGTFLSEYLDTIGVTYALYTFVFITLVASVTALFFKRETRGEMLLDTREDAGHMTYGSVSNQGSEVG